MADAKQIQGVEFVASLVPGNTAIQVNGKDGMRIQLEIPTSEQLKALRAVAFQGKLIRVRMEEA